MYRNDNFRIWYRGLLLMGIIFLGLYGQGMAQDGVNTNNGEDPYAAWAKGVMDRRTLADAALETEDSEQARKGLWYDLALRETVPCDWLRWDLAQDPIQAILPWDWFILTEPEATAGITRAIVRVEQELGNTVEPPKFESLESALTTYAQRCEARRFQRLQTVLEKSPQIIFSKHLTLGGSHYAYTEAQSDAQAERVYRPGAELRLLRLSAQNGRIATELETLLGDDKCVIRDAEVSWDGTRILFSWKKSDLEDDFHLYEMDLADPAHPVRAITTGDKIADIEPAYLPNGDILFASSRCVQIVDCWWTEVSNLYTCDPDGRFLRRLTFDQVHDTFPTVLKDGRVAYTRWEYNDRGQIFPQPLFAMNPDGTNQTEFYGNTSWFPTTILHARSLPDSDRVVAIAAGPHTRQTGKLIVIDPSKGRQENAGVTLVAPVRETPAVRVDAYGQDGELFQYPYPITETEYLVSYHPDGWARGMKAAIYWFAEDGRRELLYESPSVPCNKPVPMVARETPHLRPSVVDYTKSEGTVYLQDLYAGGELPASLTEVDGAIEDGLPITGRDPRLEGEAAVGRSLAGVPRGVVKTLRVVTIDFRSTGIGRNGNGGPGGGALVSTPVSINNGAWDPKRIIGDVPIHEDGSASFTVPARTPVYFQLLDENGRMVQSMRSWTTLQPGETQSCVGCHEPKSQTPRVQAGLTLAQQTTPTAPNPLHGDERWFSFPEQIQPILDRHCVRCHDGSVEAPTPNLTAEIVVDPIAKRKWSRSYLELTQSIPLVCGDEGVMWQGNPDGELVNWISAQSVPSLLPPYPAGSNRSRFITLLDENHEDVKLSKPEMDRIAAWIDLGVPYCGNYTEAGTWTDAEWERYRYYDQKRQRGNTEDAEQIQALLKQLTNEEKN